MLAKFLIEFTVPEACLALEKRLRPLLLASLPQSIKEDCVTAGRLAVVDLLFAVHVAFSPGGSEDKAACSMLKHPLTDFSCEYWA